MRQRKHFNCVRIPFLIATSLVCIDLHAEINAPGYKVEQLVQPSAFHGVHGLAFDAQDRLYAGSVVGQSVYRVDTATGKVEVIVGPPEGMADDLVFLPDGTVVWTAINQNAVRARKGDGPIRVLAEHLASVNSIAYRKSDGRLFVAQVFGGDGLWELDPAGVKAPRSILKDIGGLNGFDIGPDGWIYGPLWFKKQVVKINPDTGELKVVAEGFHTPAAANFDSKWNLYVLDTALGTVNRIDIKSGAKQVVAQLATSLDNLAIDSKDRMFVSNMADNGIQEVDVQNGRARQVVKGKLAIPFGIAAVAEGNHDLIYVADIFALRTVDGNTGRVVDLQRSHAANAHIDYPVGVSANSKHVLVLNSNGTLQRYGRDGKFQQEWPGLIGLSSALELTDSSVLVAQRGGINLISADKRRTVATGLDGAQGLTAIDSENVYVTDVAGGQIVRSNIATGAKQVVASELNLPQGLAVDKAGQLLTVEFGKKRIVSINPNSGALKEIASGLNLGFTNSERAERPIGLTVGATGIIYVTSDAENSIYKITRQ
jgi:sugar lactone lactonase YvrE